MPIKYVVDLSADERTELLQLIGRGKPSARKVVRARILLKADDGFSDAQIVAALDTSRPTVERTRKRFVEGGLARAPNDKRHIFLFFEPERGYRHLDITAQRTMRDFAQCMQWLVDSAYPDAECIRLVVDNLNTHKPAALYETFAPAEANRILKRLEFHYTPKHGSWLNMAEIELSVFSRVCWDGRIPDVDTLKRHTAALEAERNTAQATVDWRFTSCDARVKLGRF